MVGRRRKEEKIGTRIIFFLKSVCIVSLELVSRICFYALKIEFVIVLHNKMHFTHKLNNKLVSINHDLFEL